MFSAWRGEQDRMCDALERICTGCNVGGSINDKSGDM